MLGYWVVICICIIFVNFYLNVWLIVNFKKKINGIGKEIWKERKIKKIYVYNFILCIMLNIFFCILYILYIILIFLMFIFFYILGSGYLWGSYYDCDYCKGFYLGVWCLCLVWEEFD